MFRSLLIANRGEIACRIIRTAKRLGMRTIAIYADADRDAQPAALADEAFGIGAGAPAQCYLNIERILAIATATNAEAIHPGYGFLSENATFATACEAAGRAFVGAPPEAIAQMGDKRRAKQLMQAAGVPLIAGYHGTAQAPAQLLASACEIGFPVLLKATAGGGGRGIRRVDTAGQFDAALAAVKREAETAFGDSAVLIEKLIRGARHIEIQIFADHHGNVVHLFERDCSLQRRRQKVVEEAPASDLSASLREAMRRVALQAATAIQYRGAGSVELLVDGNAGRDAQRFYFIEMNTRLQVEHPVTEMVTDIDLVEWQLRIAAGEPLPLQQEALVLRGHAIEARIYAEDAQRDFMPTTGVLARWRLPPPSPAIRIDAGVVEGDRITSHFDPLIGKLIAHGEHRQQALDRLQNALAQLVIAGCTTNLPWLKRLLAQPRLREGWVDIDFIERQHPQLILPAPLPDSAWVFAALYAMGQFADTANTAGTPRPECPWEHRGGWRAFGTAQQYIVLKCASTDQQQEIALCFSAEGELSVGVCDTTYSVLVLTPTGDGQLRLQISGRIHRARITPLNGALLVHGSDYQECFHHRIDDDAASNANRTPPSEIIAPLPGRVAALCVAQADRVHSGALLLTLEAMKMQIAITAPFAASVKHVLVSRGAAVHQGQTLIELEALTHPANAGSDDEDTAAGEVV